MQHTTTHIFRLIRLLKVCLLILLFLNISPRKPALAESETYKERVLFISSYDSNFLSVPDQIEGLKSVLTPLSITVDTEYMDMKRFDTKENESIFYEMLQYKLKYIKYDAVIVGDDSALHFAMKHQEELFLNLPIVFLGINNMESAVIAAENQFITGIVEEASLKENIELGLLINPNAKKVVAIVDNTLTGVGNREQFYSYKNEFKELDFEIINVGDYTFDEIGPVLENIEGDSILLYFSMYTDKAGRNLTIPEAISILTEHVKVPILRSEVGGVGLGILGGKMISYYEAGRIAANMIVNVFQGTPIQEIALVKKSPNYYIFDYDIIKKYQIDEKILPEDATFVNKELSFLQENKELVQWAIAIFLFLFVIVVILVIDNIKQRKIEKKLQESHEELTQTFEELTASEEELRAQYETIEEYANFDFLTKLPNRLSFMEKLQAELSSGRAGTILFFDLDNFKSANDTLGHAFGDRILQSVAKRLLKVACKDIFVSRFGGDEFLILIPDLVEQEEIEDVIAKIMKLFEKELVINQLEYFVTFSIGVTSFPKDSMAIDQLIMFADTAMYEAKHTGKNKHMFFCNKMMLQLQHKNQIEAALRMAIKTDGFYLVYQPQVDVNTGNIVGFEALLRIKENLFSPAEFIPVAEETGLIMEMGRWVTKEVITQLARWSKKGYQLKPVAINYSSKQLRDKGYIEYLKQLLVASKIDSKFIEIEITESILLEDSRETYDFLIKLKDMGISIALDDFGTGYSSLNYLTYIPVDKIKLDKSLCEKFLELGENNVMNSIIRLAHSLKLEITAEGIEFIEQYHKLKEDKCNYIQGYLFCKPLVCNEIEEIYNSNMLNKLFETK
ncbi:MAG: diguanylate cyclase protein [Anaerocolumna sp.]|nr:diguanylate cyclase protein [Anaerocolumna sp.]